MHFLEGGHHRQNLKSRLQEQGAFIHRNTRNTKKKFLALQIYLGHIPLENFTRLVFIWTNLWELLGGVLIAIATRGTPLIVGWRSGRVQTLHPSMHRIVLHYKELSFPKCQ